jgi:hypothetical protein
VRLPDISRTVDTATALPSPRVCVVDKNRSPRAAGDILRIIRAAATAHSLCAYPVAHGGVLTGRLGTAFRIAFRIAFGPSSRAYRPRSPGSPRRPRFDPRSSLREHWETRDPESKTEGKIKAWCHVLGK